MSQRSNFLEGDFYNFLARLQKVQFHWSAGHFPLIPSIFETSPKFADFLRS